MPKYVCSVLLSPSAAHKTRTLMQTIARVVNNDDGVVLEAATHGLRMLPKPVPRGGFKREYAALSVSMTFAAKSSTLPVLQELFKPNNSVLRISFIKADKELYISPNRAERMLKSPAGRRALNALAEAAENRMDRARALNAEDALSPESYSLTGGGAALTATSPQGEHLVPAGPTETPAVVQAWDSDQQRFVEHVRLLSDPYWVPAPRDANAAGVSLEEWQQLDLD